MNLIIFDWGRTLYDPETKTLFSETRNVLEYLKSKDYVLAIVALATAGQEKIAERRRIIQEENLRPYFSSIKFDVSNKEQMYDDTIKELGLAYTDVIIVDDRVMRGIKWGNQHKCTTVWVEKGKFADELPNNETGEPDYKITSISELKTLL